jgi:hypothetical protein
MGKVLIGKITDGKIFGMKIAYGKNFDWKKITDGKILIEKISDVKSFNRKISWCKKFNWKITQKVFNLKKLYKKFVPK